MVWYIHCSYLPDRSRNNAPFTRHKSLLTPSLPFNSILTEYLYPYGVLLTLLQTRSSRLRSVKRVNNLINFDFLKLLPTEKCGRGQTQNTACPQRPAKWLVVPPEVSCWCYHGYLIFTLHGRSNRGCRPSVVVVRLPRLLQRPVDASPHPLQPPSKTTTTLATPPPTLIQRILDSVVFTLRPLPTVTAL